LGVEELGSNLAELKLEKGVDYLGWKCMSASASASASAQCPASGPTIGGASTKGGRVELRASEILE
jgi:hypothetical protein